MDTGEAKISKMPEDDIIREIEEFLRRHARYEAIPEERRQEKEELIKAMKEHDRAWGRVVKELLLAAWEDTKVRARAKRIIREFTRTDEALFTAWIRLLDAVVDTQRKH